MKRILLVLTGLFLFLILLEGALRAGGFVMSARQDLRNAASLRQKRAYRILCLGESTTQNQWPPFLQEILNRQNTAMRFSVIDKGLTGTTTAAILSKVPQYLDEYRPDMVVAMMGVNDAAGHIPPDQANRCAIAQWACSLKISKLAQLIVLHLRARARSIAAAQEPEPADYAGCIRRARAAYDQGMFDLAEKYLDKAAAAGQLNEFSCIEIGWLFHDIGRYEQAEYFFKKAFEFNPASAMAHIGLGRIFHDRWRHLQTQKLYAQARDSYKKSEESFKKSLQSDPRNPQGYIELGWLYFDVGQFDDAQECLNTALEIDPVNYWAYRELGRLYAVQGQYHQAERYYRKSLELNPGCGYVYTALADLYLVQGRVQDALACYQQVLGSGPRDRGNYNPATAFRYRQLKALLDEKKIRLVCVQYPLCPVQPLKEIFKADGDNILFVDNEKSFKDAIDVVGYDAYFTDRFGVYFGHCTDKGNLLLAENIAKVIIAGVAKK